MAPVTGIFGNAALEQLFLQVYLNSGNSSAGTFDSAETYKLNAIFGPQNVTRAVAADFEKAVKYGTTQLDLRSNDICGNVFITNLPNSYGLAAAGYNDNASDLYNALVVPPVVSKTKVGGQLVLDPSSAVPLLYGTNELGGLSVGTLGLSDYWTTTIAGQQVLTVKDVESGATYPQVDFSNCYELVVQALEATNGSSIDGSANGVNMINMEDLKLNAKYQFPNPNANPNLTAAANAGGPPNGSTNRTLTELVKMISDCSLIDMGNPLGRTNYASYPTFGANGSTQDVTSQLSRDISAGGCAGGPDLGGSITTINRFTSDVSAGVFGGFVNDVDCSGVTLGDAKQQAATIRLAKTNYLKPNKTNLSNLNSVVKDLRWHDVYDLAGFGLNQMAWSGSNDLVDGLVQDVQGDGSIEAQSRFVGTTSTWSYNSTTGKTNGHSVQQGLLDQLMKQPALEMIVQADGSSNQIANAPEIDGVVLRDDLSSARVYQRLVKLKEMGVQIDTLLNWKEYQKTVDGTLTTYVNDMSSTSYNFAGYPRGISGGNVAQATTFQNGTYGISTSLVGGFVDFSSNVALDISKNETLRQNPADIPWDYTAVCKAAYPNTNIFENLSVYDIVTHLGSEQAVWSQLPSRGIYQRMDMCLNTTGKNNYTLTYTTGTKSTCKATDILKVFDSLNAFAPLSLDDNTAHAKYSTIWEDSSASGMYPTGADSTTNTAITALGNSVAGAKAGLEVHAYNDASGTAGVEYYGASVPAGSVSYPSQAAVYGAAFMNNLVDPSNIENYSQCPSITADNVKAVINTHVAGRFNAIPYSSMVGGYMEASNQLMAASFLTAASDDASVDANVATLFVGKEDLCFNNLVQVYKSIFNETTMGQPVSNVQIVNKLLADNYTSAVTNADATNQIINNLLDAGHNITVDDIVSLNPANWNNTQQIGDTIGVYATATDTSISRSQDIAEAFASNATIAAQFFDDISMQQDISYTNTTGTLQAGGSAVPNAQEKADMVDFLLFFNVDQEKIWTMMGANDYTRTYWLKNWFTNTRQADASYQSVTEGGTINAGANRYGGFFNIEDSTGYAAPQSYIIGAKDLIRKVSIANWASDADFGVSYPGWGSYKATNPSWMLAYQPYELKAAGIACEGVITSCITTGYIIDPTTLAIEGTAKCAFTPAQLKASGGPKLPGYTQAEIDAAIGTF